MYWKCIYNYFYKEDFKNKNFQLIFKKTLPVKRDYKLLIDKNYIFYKYWYPFFAKKLERRVYSDYALLYRSVTDIQKKIVGKIIYNYINYFLVSLSNDSFFLKKRKKNINIITYYYYFNSVFKSKCTFKGILNTVDYNIIIFDLRFKKPKLYSINNDMCVFSVSSGIILKQIDVKEKSFKKHQRVFNVMLKGSLNKLTKLYNSNKFILHIKGTKSNFYKMIIFLKKFTNVSNLIIMYSPMISRNKIKLKKLKSIKRNLRKKMLKI